MFKLGNMDVIGGILQQSFFPVVVPVTLFVVGLTTWAYFVSKDKRTLKNYWFIPVGFLIAALIVALVFHQWNKVGH